MIYFICWVVFLVGIILAVPIVNWLDQRGKPSKRAAVVDDENAEGFGDEAVEMADVDDGMPADDGFGDGGFGDGGFGDGGFGGGKRSGKGAATDDFAAFEDEFK